MERTPAVRTRVRLHRSLLVVALGVLLGIAGLLLARPLLSGIGAAAVLYGVVAAIRYRWIARRNRA